MAHLALLHNYLYSVAQSDWRTFSLQPPELPQLRSITPPGWGI
jgi:hypothetical protein